MSKILYAGPWAGEFGWELCSWNPLVRKKSREYDRTIIEGPPSSEFLYSDFADTFISNPAVPETSDGYVGRNEHAPKIDRAWDTMDPQRLWKKFGHKEKKSLSGPFDKYQKKFAEQKEWRSFRSETGEKVADVMCAFRPAKISLKGKLRDEKEYSIQRCEELVDILKRSGLSVACFGGNSNFYIDGTIDFRGRPLPELCAALSQSKCVAGPSSGTLHLASLCESPHVTWYGREWDSYTRYEAHWNPFGTAMTFVKEPNPTPETVAEAILARMDEAPPSE